MARVPYRGADYRGIFLKIYAHVDVILLLSAFIFLYIISLDYHPRTRLFPRTFLIIGILALIVELIVGAVLPSNYRERIEEYTQGVTGDIEESMIESFDMEEREENMAGLPGITFDPRLRISLLILLIIGYGVTIYVIGFLLPTVLFVPAVIFLLGSQSILRAIITTALVVLTIAVLFGELMNVPLTLYLTGWELIIR